MMDFSPKSSASCFSSQCGLCHSCCGNIGGPTGRVKNNYYYPGYVDEKPIYPEDNKHRNWWKYQDMLKIAQEKLEEVRDSYTEETPALTSELFAISYEITVDGLNGLG